MNKTGKIFIFGVFSMVLGAFCGTIVWTVLQIMSVGMELLWETLPKVLGKENSLAYNLIVCLIGGLIIGLWQKKYGILPDDMHQVMRRVKIEGGYPYDRLHIVAVSALLPLIFGGALGPEAGLIGLIVGLCCFVGDKLKYKGDEVAALAEAGMAATVGIIFNAPLFGIVDNLEPDDKKEQYRKKLVSKRARIFIYVMGVAGGMLAMAGLGKIFGGSSGLPRFEVQHRYGWDQWKWFLLLIAVGVIFGLLYLCFEKVISMIAERILEHRILSCLIAGAAVAVTGYFLPLAMFSGEHEMGELMRQWQTCSVTLLILTAIGKLFLVNMCISFGWRGGSIFPIIYSGVSLGYAMAMITGMDGGVAVAVTVAAMYAYIMRKPVTVAAVLLLCFPVTYIPAILISSFIASKTPAPKAFASHEE